MKRQIRDWFEERNGDEGDFFVAINSYPFTIIPPKADTETIIYCTKQHCISRLVHELGHEPRFAAILRGGLPSDDDAKWLPSLIGSRRLVFMGDADPADLLVFAWLREHLAVEYGGLSDQLLLRCGVDLSDKLTIKLKESETAALPMATECLGDLTSQLGPWCAGLLASGRKIELEALFSFAACTAFEIEVALLESNCE